MTKDEFMDVLQTVDFMMMKPNVITSIIDKLMSLRNKNEVEIRSGMRKLVDHDLVNKISDRVYIENNVLVKLRTINVNDIDFTKTYSEASDVLTTLNRLRNNLAKYDQALNMLERSLVNLDLLQSLFDCRRVYDYRLMIMKDMIRLGYPENNCDMMR